MEIDLLSRHEDHDNTLLVECKFQREPVAAEVVSKLVGNHSIRQTDEAVLYYTGHLSPDAKGLFETFKGDEKHRRIREVGPEKLYARILDCYGLCEPNESLLDVAHATVGTRLLILLPEKRVWLAETYIRDGAPSSYAVKALTGNTPTAEQVQDACSKTDLADLQLTIVGESTSSNTLVMEVPSPVAQVLSGDSLLDYRPSRAEDFVGREQLIAGLKTLVADVASKSAEGRLVWLTGPSGFGKSSAIIKLRDSSRISKIAKYTVYAVDCRSATGPSFVGRALRDAVVASMPANQAGQYVMGGIYVDSTAGDFLNESIRVELERLAAEGRVLLLFFDQFEEILSKPELRAVFEAMRRLVLEVESERRNLLVGFSWRTGMVLGEDNPAYHLWSNYKDRSKEFVVGPMSDSEMRRLINRFEKESGARLDGPLGDQLISSCNGVPWILKKLLIHISGQLKLGKTEQELARESFNVQSLFEADLQGLPADELAGLRHIAGKAPVDIVEALEFMDESVIQRLQNRRLLVRSGSRLSLYWDNFRDYVLTNQVPRIPLQHFPNHTPKTVVGACSLLYLCGEINQDSLPEHWKYNTGTSLNIVADLVSLGLAKRTGPGVIRPTTSEAKASKVTADVVTAFQDHTLVAAVHKSTRPGGALTWNECEELVRDTLSHRKLSTTVLRSYTTRALKWLLFAGVLERDDQGSVRRPHGIGKQVGRTGGRRLRGAGSGVGGSVFLAASGFERAVSLLARLSQGECLSVDSRRKGPDRNSVQDLLALDLIVQDGRQLRINPNLGPEQSIREAVGLRARRSLLLTTVARAYENFLTDGQLANELKHVLGVDLADSSITRYVSAAKTWLKKTQSV